MSATYTKIGKNNTDEITLINGHGTFIVSKDMCINWSGKIVRIICINNKRKAVKVGDTCSHITILETPNLTTANAIKLLHKRKFLERITTIGEDDFKNILAISSCPAPAIGGKRRSRRFKKSRNSCRKTLKRN